MIRHAEISVVNMLKFLSRITRIVACRVWADRAPVRNRRCTRLGETCTYSKRRSRLNRPQTPAGPFVGSASDPSVYALSTLQAGRGVSAALRQYGSVPSLKRCRLSPSPATGLVGMQENMFLSDYFGCVGFLPFTSQSNIRKTLVNMFAGSVSVQHSTYSTTEHHFDAIMPADSQLAVDPSTCVFWCAVALGALAKGRPIESVEKYSRLAKEALANASGPANAEVARAWAILAYMSDFCGDRDNFHEFVKRANAILCDVPHQENTTLPVGFSDVVKHGETIRIFVGDVNKEEVESFFNQERAIPKITQAATEGEICKFVMQSYRSFEQALYQNVVEHRPSARGLGADGGHSTNSAPTDPDAADLLRGSSPHFITSLILQQEAESGSSDLLDMMITMLKAHSRQFEQIELAARRSNIREGIGGLVINGTLVFERVARKDIRGALGNLESCGEVFQRYPGLCRFTMGAHMSHMLLANLAVIDDPRARAVYVKIRAAYNSALLPGTSAIPPFEQWQGVSACCNNYNCRLMEYMVRIERGIASFPPPPQERATVMKEEGPRDVPVHGQRQKGFPSASRSPDGAEGSSSSTFDTQSRHKTINASRSNVRCMENVSSNGRRTAMTQQPKPTTTSVFRDVATGPMADSDVSRSLNEQSNSNRLSELGALRAEALLSLEFNRGRAMIGETDDEGIDVEDWLEVTHAMLDTADSGLDLV